MLSSLGIKLVIYHFTKLMYPRTRQIQILDGINLRMLDRSRMERGILHARQHLSRGVLPRFDAPIQMYRKMTGSEYV